MRSGVVVELVSGQSDDTRKILKELYQDHSDAVRRFLYKRVREPADVEDIVQDLFIRISRQSDLRERLDGGEGQSRSYLYTIANNLVVDMERKKAVRWRYSAEHADQSQSSVDDLSPDVIVIAKEHMQLVKQAIKTLRPEHRTAFILNRFKHMSHKEIAEVMGVKSRQVEGYVAAALSNLRKRVAKMYQDSCDQGGQK